MTTHFLILHYSLYFNASQLKVSFFDQTGKTFEKIGETYHCYNRQKEICQVTGKVFLSLLHNILNALFGVCHVSCTLGSGNCLSPESSSIVRVNKKFSSTNPLMRKSAYSIEN